MKPYEYLIIAGGQPPSARLLRRLAALCRIVVTVDRGAEAAIRAGLTPDLHVGDDDSVTPATLKKIPRRRRLTLPKRKSVSDLEYAISILPDSRPILVAGAHRDADGRMDHVFINLLLALKYPRLVLADEKMWIRGLKRGTFTFSAPKGTSFSVVPVRPQKISIAGSAFDVKNKKFSNASLGLSNAAKKKNVRVTTREPALLFVAAPLNF